MAKKFLEKKIIVRPLSAEKGDEKMLIKDFRIIHVGAKPLNRYERRKLEEMIRYRSGGTEIEELQIPDNATPEDEKDGVFKLRDLLEKTTWAVILPEEHLKWLPHLAPQIDNVRVLIPCWKISMDGGGVGYCHFEGYIQMVPDCLFWRESDELVDTTERYYQRGGKTWDQIEEENNDR